MSAIPDPKLFERLSTFYLGRGFDPQRGEADGDLVLYDAKDLTTHALVVGMTGSGKTGLCVSLLEEAALDGVPAICIDPKGDIGNLLLTFPDLAAGDFAPWVDPAAAATKGQSVEDFAQATAALWQDGLAAWGQDGARIARLKGAAEFVIYTPGANIGVPVSVLRSFSAPPQAVLDDADTYRDRVQAAVSGLLALMGEDADPMSREHILLANILDHAWQEGRDLDLPGLIQTIQAPPFTKLGVMDLDTVYPAKDRLALSMRLNNLLASPGFGAWLEGEALNIKRLLYSPAGKPRVSVLSIAHLSDAERMFFVTLLLNEVIAWMRAQSGTSALRALLYMDEVFGYFPPNANPPAKTPMLTLLKQARAYGLGVVLATQNPVDLDYKGLSNCGTWFLGRLQTERDKLRVLDGLASANAEAGAAFDRKAADNILSSLKGRTFLMNNVHDKAPTLFHTRWAMSYLRGPLNREQIRDLMAERRAAANGAAIAGAGAGGDGDGSAAAPASVLGAQDGEGSPVRPTSPDGVPVLFMGEGGAGAVYEPALLGVAELHYSDKRKGLDQFKKTALLAYLADLDALGDLWESAEIMAADRLDLVDEPGSNARFLDLPKKAGRKTSYRSWGRALKNHLYQHETLSLFAYKPLKLVSAPGEDRADFAMRAMDHMHEQRDLELAKLRKKYAPKVERLQARILKAEAKVEREQAQFQERRNQALISVGAGLLGAVFGRKIASVTTVSKAGTAMRGISRAARERGDIERAQVELTTLHQQLAALNQEFADAVATRQALAGQGALELDEIAVRPKKSAIQIESLALVWVAV